MAEFVKVAKKSDIPSNTGLSVMAKGKEIALFQYQGKVYALDHTCPHQGGPLAEGGVDEGVVTCPWHGWSFKVADGTCTFNPSIRQSTYRIKEEGEDVFVEV